MSEHTISTRRRTDRQIGNDRRRIEREREQPPIVLVACSAQKLGHAAAAKDLYVGDLFKKARAYAEQLGGSWLILSAKHGLINPERVIEPYDECLADKTSAQRDKWTEMVRKQWWNGAHRPVIVLAGAAYREWLEGIEHEAPMAGMGIGQQKAWLKAQISEGKALNALRVLHDVCVRMDLETQNERPTEEQYQAALATAASMWMSQAHVDAMDETMGEPI